MATLAGQRAQFTWALNQYDLSQNPDTRRPVCEADGKVYCRSFREWFTVDEVTQQQVYPSLEVNQYLNDPSVNEGSEITEAEAVRTVGNTVGTSDRIRIGEGKGVRNGRI